jgi:ferredoxin
MDKILEERNSRLHYGIEVPLGDNSLAIRTPDDKIKQRLENSDKMLDSLVQAVKMRDVTKANAVFRKKAISTFHGKTIRLVMRYYYRFEDRKIDRAVCSNCGLCHRICPVNNIHYEEGEVRIGENCAECFACINYCPNQAIRFGRLHPRIDTQYRFPKVTAMDIIGQKSGS